MLRVTLSVGNFSRSKLTAKRAGNFAMDKIRSKRNFKPFYIPHDDDLHVTEAECKEIIELHVPFVKHLLLP